MQLASNDDGLGVLSESYSWEALYANLAVGVHRWSMVFPTLTLPRVKVCLSIYLTDEQAPYQERLLWTMCVAGLYLLLEQSPAYGLRKEEEDYFIWLRPYFHSKSGSVSL